MTTITIESGPRNASTDPRTGLRSYTWQGKAYPSVTSIRRLAGVPHNLVAWQVSRIVERATLDVVTLNEMLTRERRPRERAIESNRIEEAGKWLRSAATEERDAAASLGAAVHDAAAAGLKPADIGETVTFIKDGKPVEVPGADIRPRLHWYRDWLTVSGAEVLGSEFQLVNETVGYAGSCDALVRFPNGSIWVVDYKTGSGTYTDHALQLIAYARAELVFRDDTVDDRLTKLLHEATGIAVLHIKEDGWSYQAMRHDEEAWNAFVGLLAFARWSSINADVSSVIEWRRESGERDIIDRRIAAQAAHLREQAA